MPCFPGSSVVKILPASAEDMGLISGLGRAHEEGNGDSYLGNPMDRGVWWAKVLRVTRESDMT